MTSNSLMMAVLAMDTYNRGSYPKVYLGDTSGYSIGEYTSLEVDSGYSNGFSAVVYQNQNNSRVISYRGTDFNNGGPTGLVIDYATAALNAALAVYTHGALIQALGNVDLEQYDRTLEDFRNGYPIGLGSSDAAQLENAMDLYDRYSNGSVTVLGQSMGGGIAGYISSLTGAKGIVYENMPFYFAVWEKVSIDLAANKISVAEAYNVVSRAWNMESYSVRGEFLGFARGDVGFNPVTSPSSSVFDNMSGTHHPFNIHGQAMVVIHMFLNQSYKTDVFEAAAFDVFSHINDSDIHQFVSLSLAPGGLGQPGDQLTSMIAYSVIDSGTRIFGDVAIRALENDIGAIERFRYAQPSESSVLTDLSRFVMAFGADMANRKVSAYSPGVDNSRSLSGVVDFGYGSNILTLDLSTATWGRDVSASTAPGASSLVETLIQNVTAGDAQAIDQAVSQVMGSLGVSSVWGDFESYSMIFQSSSGYMRLATSTPTTMVVSMATGPDSSDNISGRLDYSSGFVIVGNELIFGGDGDDVISGNGGRDVLIGGSGNDRLQGGFGSDALLGGVGNDLLVVGGDAYQGMYGQSGSVDETDIWDGGADRDVLTFDGFSSPKGVVINMTDEMLDTQRFEWDGSGYVLEAVHIGARQGRAGSVVGSISNIEEVIGTSSADTFIGNGATSFKGGYGRDVFHLAVGDTADGGADADVFYLRDGVIARGGDGADEFRYVLDPSWDTVTIRTPDLQYNDKVYLQWGGHELLLSAGLPTAGYRQDAPEVTLNRVGSTVVQVDNGRKITYHDSGEVTSLTHGGSVLGFSYYGHSLMSDYLHYPAISQMVGVPYSSEIAALISGYPIGGSLGASMANGLGGTTLLAGSHLAGMMANRVGYPMGQTNGVGDINTSLFVTSGLRDVNGYMVGPTDSDGSPKDVFVLDASAETDGVWIYGPSGYETPSYSLMGSSEHLIGGSGGDFLVAGKGTGLHILDGNAGNDFLAGREGNDILNGGWGDDLITPGFGNDIVNGGSGRDVVDYSNLVLDFDAMGHATGINMSVVGDHGFAAGLAGSDVFSGVEVFVGTRGSDNISVSSGAVVLGGGGGDVFNVGHHGVAFGGTGYEKDVFNVTPHATVMLGNVGWEDEIWVGGVKVTGLSYDTVFEKANVSADGSYDVIQRTMLASSHMNGVTETNIGHYDAIEGVFTESAVQLNSNVSGMNVLYTSGSAARLMVDGAIIYIDGWRDGAAGLTYEALTGQRYGSPGPDGPQGMSLAEVSTYSSSWFGSNYGLYMPMTETIPQIQSEFGLL